MCLCVCLSECMHECVYVCMCALEKDSECRRANQSGFSDCIDDKNPNFRGNENVVKFRPPEKFFAPERNNQQKQVFSALESTK